MLTSDWLDFKVVVFFNFHHKVHQWVCESCQLTQLIDAFGMCFDYKVTKSKMVVDSFIMGYFSLISYVIIRHPVVPPSFTYCCRSQQYGQIYVMYNKPLFTMLACLQHHITLPHRMQPRSPRPVAGVENSSHLAVCPRYGADVRIRRILKQAVSCCWLRQWLWTLLAYHFA